jgi:hypothetical protein
MMKIRNAGINFIFSAILGAIIWAVSPTITGSIEPWDAGTKYYIISLIMAGIITGIICPRNLLAAYVGILAGQLLYILITGQIGPLFIIGVLFLLVYSLTALAGVAIGSRFRRAIVQLLKGSRAGA